MQHEPDFRSFLSALTTRVLDGCGLTADEAVRLIEAESSADIHDLLAAANRIREKFKGNKVHLCSIVNAKAGACPEDCKFCAQSATYETGSPRHSFVEPEAVIKAAGESHANYAQGLGIVAAWRGLKEGPMLDEVCRAIEALARSGTARADASLGII